MRRSDALPHHLSDAIRSNRHLPKTVILRIHAQDEYLLARKQQKAKAANQRLAPQPGRLVVERPLGVRESSDPRHQGLAERCPKSAHHAVGCVPRQRGRPSTCEVDGQVALDAQLRVLSRGESPDHNPYR